MLFRRVSGILMEEKGTLNIAWFMYEFIALAIPMKHTHALGQCNKEMTGRLHKYLRTSVDEGEDDDSAVEEGFEMNNVEKPIDPRWNELKKFLDNN